MTVGAAVILAVPAAPSAEGKAEVVKPFNGVDLKGWKVKGPETRSKWVVGIARMDEKNAAKLVYFKEPPSGAQLEMVNPATSLDIYTERKFGDCVVEVEFMIPKGSNSGVYMMGEYEVQILDSYGKKKVGPGDMGGLYGAAAPLVNACKKPGEFQKFVIDFQAPRFKDGKKVANAKFIKVTLNDQVIHENVEMKQQTPGGLTGKEHATGPLMFQGNHGPITIRTITITPKGEK
jgi:hypothetical protein